MTITPEEVAKLREAASPGPWEIDYYPCRANHEDVEHERTRNLKRGEVRRNLSVGDILWRSVKSIGPLCPDHDHWSGWTLGCDEDDAAFIAAAHDMADLIERQAREMDSLASALRAAEQSIVDFIGVTDARQHSGAHHILDEVQSALDAYRALIAQEGGK